MLGFFGRKAHRDLEQVIFDLAEDRNEQDFEALYRLLQGRQLYLPVDAASLPAGAESGARYEVGKDDRLLARTVRGPSGETLVPVTTQISAKLLAGGHVLIKWRDFLEMVMKISTVQGALLQGRTSWVILDRKRIESALKS